jgi:hypothetical protein
VIDWQLVCLAFMAAALTANAVVQVFIMRALTRSAREVVETAQQIRQEVRPIAEKAHRIADDAARAAALAVTQVERVDRALTATSQRLDDTLNLVQGTLIQPVRHGAAVVSALRAAFSLFRRPARDTRPSRDEEEALFVG